MNFIIVVVKTILIEFVSSLLLKWAVGEDRPESGSLVKLVTEGGNTSLVCM